MQKDCDIKVLPGTLALRLFLDTDETRIYTVDENTEVGDWLSKLASDGVLRRRSQTLLVFPIPQSGLKNPIVLGDQVGMAATFSAYPGYFPFGEVVDVFMTDIEAATGALYESQASSLSSSIGSFSFDYESPRPSSLGSLPPTVPARGSNAPPRWSEVGEPPSRLPSRTTLSPQRTSSGYTSTESMTSSEPRFSDSPDTFAEAVDEVLAARRRGIRGSDPDTPASERTRLGSDALNRMEVRAGVEARRDALRPSRPSEREQESREGTSPLAGLLGATAPRRDSSPQASPARASWSSTPSSSVRGTLSNMDEWFD